MKWDKVRLFDVTDGNDKQWTSSHLLRPSAVADSWADYMHRRLRATMRAQVG
jgi:hypothetical protein